MKTGDHDFQCFRWARNPRIIADIHQINGLQTDVPVNTNYKYYHGND